MSPQLLPFKKDIFNIGEKSYAGFSDPGRPFTVYYREDIWYVPLIINNPVIY